MKDLQNTAKNTKSFKIQFYAFLLYILQWLLFFTCKKKYIILGKITKKPCVMLFWHQKLAMMPFVYRKIYNNFHIKNKKPYVMISNHNDGELVAQNIALFGIQSIRGSTYDGATALLKQAFVILDKQNDVLITPDGPRGPCFSISFGSYAIARKKKLPTMILDYKISSFWQLKSWDKLIIPKPFSTITFCLGEPFYINDKNDDIAKSQVKLEFEKVENTLKSNKR